MKKLLYGFILVFFMGSFHAQEAEVLSNLGDDISNAQVSLSQTLGEISVTDISNTSLTLEQGFQNTLSKIGVEVNAKVFLQGAYDELSGLLRDDLRSQGFIPNTSPYIDALVADPSVFTVTGNDAIVDWVFVEIRDRNLSALVLEETSAFVQRDGDIVAIDGVSPLKFDLFPGQYFISVSHRNHLGIISQNPEAIAKDDYVFDFTDGTVPIQGGILGSWQFGDGTLALIAGDVNGTDQVKITGLNNDLTSLRSAILTNPNNIFNSPNFNIIGYSEFDLNLNGRSNIAGLNNDLSILRSIILNAAGNIFGSPNFILSQQF